jgi:putative flavoprotein involved in K+ transport
MPNKLNKAFEKELDPMRADAEAGVIRKPESLQTGGGEPNLELDDYPAEHNIDAPAGVAYVPLWTPECETTELVLAHSGVTNIIECIGFQPDFNWVDVPVFNGRSYPGHTRGVTAQKGLYFFSGISRDAQYVVDNVSSVRITS